MAKRRSSEPLIIPMPSTRPLNIYFQQRANEGNNIDTSPSRNIGTQTPTEHFSFDFPPIVKENEEIANEMISSKSASESTQSLTDEGDNIYGSKQSSINRPPTSPSIMINQAGLGARLGLGSSSVQRTYSSSYGFEDIGQQLRSIGDSLDNRATPKRRSSIFLGRRRSMS